MAARVIGRARLRRSIRRTDVFIVAFPKSGTTWVSYFMARLLWRRTGTFDEPTDIFEFQDIIPPVNREYFGLKPIPRFPKLRDPRIFRLHAPYDSLLPRVVYLVRDPRAVLVSYYHYKRRTEAGFRKTLPEYIEENATWPCDWGDHVRDWLEHPVPERILWVRYEDLHERPGFEFERISRFCGHAAREDELTACMREASFRAMRKREEEASAADHAVDATVPFMRTGRVDAWREDLDARSVDLIETRYGALMRRLDYPPQASLPTVENTSRASL